MLPLSQLHVLAAKRGDGLRPEFLALLDRQACVISGNPKIAGLRDYRPETHWQAGPNPLVVIDGTPPDNVLAFPDHRPHFGEQPDKSLRPRKI
jgi:hypothetical protein